MATRPEVDYAALQRGDELANRFRIEETLGKGGFAVVYRVFDSFADASRVLKVIVKDRRSTFERLRQEYRILTQLPPHPNVLRVVWADKLPDDTPYLVFEYVPGTAVSEMFDSASLSPDDVKRLGLETLAGIQHLHNHCVFHRDIKPSNLLWTDQGVRIIDFNVAAQVEDGRSRLGGTRRYVPPDLDLDGEMSIEEKTDWDLFALGVTLYECATGGYPWDGLRPILDSPPKDPTDFPRDLSPELAQLLRHAISPRRADRFESAAAFQEALGAVSTRLATPPPKPAERSFETEPGELSLRAPKPNFNPFVSHLLTMYSQSPRSNAGTRAAGRHRSRNVRAHPS